jgi:hypothetical protein
MQKALVEEGAFTGTVMTQPSNNFLVPAEVTPTKQIPLPHTYHDSSFLSSVEDVGTEVSPHAVTLAVLTSPLMICLNLLDLMVHKTLMCLPCW